MTTEIKVGSVGPQPARILIVGEAPGTQEIAELRPFVGRSGIELTRMLQEAGILRTEVRVTNVCRYRPPGNNMEFWWPKTKKARAPNSVELDGEYFDPRVIEGINELEAEISATNPNVIVPLGNLPLWATTRHTGITKWRGSILRGIHNRNVIPTIHPAAILRTWEWRNLAVHDFRRVAEFQNTDKYPEIVKRYRLAPTLEDVRRTVSSLLSALRLGEVKVAFDIETRMRHLACFGFAWSESDAMCVPFFKQDGTAYWTQAEEVEVVLLLRQLSTHPNLYGIGQNWQYDYQYIAKYWGFEVNIKLDTMTEHHTQFPGLPKGLDFQSSLYRKVHVYWKDDGKEQGQGSDLQWWTYNCDDCCATYENAGVLLANRRDVRTAYGSPYEIQQSLTPIVARMSARGVRKDNKLARQMIFVLEHDIAEAESWLNTILGYDFNCRSPKQMQELFYERLKQPKILDRKTKRPTLNEDALSVIGKRDVLLKPLTNCIQRIRTLSNFLSVCMQPTDADGRIRCQYTIPGTETFRFASSSDPFGFGTNLQNISTGERGTLEGYKLPNLRRLFLPDPGFVIGEFDLPQADARVVAWEAEDEKLIEIFLDPKRNLHLENAEMIFSKKVSKADPQYYQAKQGVHLTNYGGKPRVLAMSLGITMHEAERFQSRWFDIHPKIKEWHRKIELQLMTKRYVENRYGYRRHYFERIEDLLSEALAWIPQSTVGIVTNLAMRQVLGNPEYMKRNLQALLQTHDSSTLQWPMLHNNWIVQNICKDMTITVPYDRPLVFTPGIKLSDKSWGDCEEVK